MDIAVDLCRRAGSVSISTRRSAWIMPKYLMGRSCRTAGPLFWRVDFDYRRELFASLWHVLFD